jgi:predicted transcriptional regulator
MNKHAINLPLDLDLQLDNIAAATGRSRSQLIADAVENYVLGRDGWHGDMDKAMADAKAGAGYDGEEVLQWMASWGGEDEKLKPLPSRS